MAVTSIFEQLDQWVTAKNRVATVEGFRLLPKSIFRVVGQASSSKFLGSAAVDAPYR